MKRPQIEWFAFSDIGPIRKNNEDVWASYPEKSFFTIADGIGGHQAGEIAAKEATIYLYNSAFPHLEKKQTKKQTIELLDLSIKKTNEHIFLLGRENEHYRGMGTTLCCLYFFGKTAFYGHVGDSRIYLLRKEKLKQLTEDHSLSNKYTRNKEILSQPQYKHIITKAIGTMSFIQPDISTMGFREGDLFFLCTDGLSDYVEEREIKNILLSNTHCLETSAKELIQTAKKNGSNDNITVLILKVASFHEENHLFR